MSLAVKVAHNTLIQIVSKTISTVLGLVAVAVITRYLGQFGFGEYTTVVTFLSFFGIIIDFGLVLVTTQMISEPGADENRILSNLFTLRFFSALVFLGLAPIIVLFLPYGGAIKAGVAVAALSFFFISLNQIFTGLFQKELRMEKASIAEVSGRVFLVMGVLATVRWSWGLLGVLATTSLSSGLNFALNYAFSRKFAKIKFRFEKEVWKEIFHRSWPLTVTIIFNLIYLKTDTLILSLVKTQSEVGIYGAAYKVIDVLVTIPFMFAGLVLPIMTVAWAEKNLDKLKNILQKSFDTMAVFALPLLFGTEFLATKVMVFVAGREFAPSGDVLRVLILAASIIFLGTVFAHGIIAINKQKKLIGAYVFTSATSLAGYLIFIPPYSYFGAAWVTIYSEFSIALLTAYVFWRFTRFLPRLRIFLKSAIASLFMLLMLNLGNLLSGNLFFLLVLSSVSYFVFLYLIGGLNFISIREVVFGQKQKNLSGG